MKPKAIYFYQYLPPWRIDVFNEMAKLYDLTIVFTNAETEGFTYNRELLLSKLENTQTIFLGNGFNVGTRPVRFGIFRIIKHVKPDIIFSHEYSPTSILVALYRKLGLFKYKYIITTSDNLKMAEDVKGVKDFFRNYVLNRSNGIVVYSSSVKKWYENRFPKLQVEICPNIQKPETLLEYRKEFKRIIETYEKEYDLKNKNIILFIGRLVHVKGLDLLLDTFSKIDNSYKLVIVGEGSQKKQLKEQVKNLNIEAKVIFTGPFSGADLYAWYDMANFFILPSRYEPFGAVVNEALIYGCPVVASKHIGALDFINESNGMIFDPLDNCDFKTILEKACMKYNKNRKRDNMMIHSFEEHIKAFNKFRID